MMKISLKQPVLKFQEDQRSNWNHSQINMYVMQIAQGGKFSEFRNDLNFLHSQNTS